MDRLLQVSGVEAISNGQGSGSLALQLSGRSMDLQALGTQHALYDRDITMGIGTAFLRVLSDRAKRAAEIMKA